MWRACDRAASALAVAVVLAFDTGAAPARAPPADDARWADVTRFGAKGDGVADDTDAFRRAAATGKDLRVPRPTAHYRLTGKVVVHGSVVGEGMPEIRMYGADGGRDNAHVMFELNRYDGPGAVFRGLHLDGQWDGRSTVGEWSHLIQIRASRNVTVEDNVLERPYGDCVLIGGEGYPAPSENVVVRNNRMTAPRRCAVAVISARRLLVRGNTISKSTDYVAAIDLEPNPDIPEPTPDYQLVEDVEISGNRFDVPGGNAIMLHSPPGNRLANRRVTISGNTATARRFLLKMAKTGTWNAVSVTENRFLGDAAPYGSGDVSFVRIDHDPQAAPRSIRQLVVERNVIDGAVRPGQTYRDYIRGVDGLRLVGNRWMGAKSYRLSVVDSPGAQLASNEPARLPP
ncbi:MAG TPA: right-handed parallel beta-helix repeat-containing protein [Anaeromyxobacter sp.]|jgi:hypothetical protein|nr:right-handed parallel beta-helix repeat-containing protein [Anaeromyxobacter sp.]